MQFGRRLREGALLLLLAIAAYFMLSLGSYSPDDPGWSFTGPRLQVVNAGGPTGAWFADVFLNLFGLVAYLFPLMVAWSGWLIFKEHDQQERVNVHLVALRWTGFFITLAAASALASMQIPADSLSLPGGSGGILGSFLEQTLVALFSFAGTTLLLLALLLGGFTLFTGISWLVVMDRIGGGLLLLYNGLLNLRDRLMDAFHARQARQVRSEAVEMPS